MARKDAKTSVYIQVIETITLGLSQSHTYTRCTRMQASTITLINVNHVHASMYQQRQIQSINYRL